MPLRRITTDKSHDREGSITMSELHRREQTFLDGQPMVTRCSIWMCEWFHEGTAAEGREAFVVHRAAEHPLAHRVAMERANRPAKGSGRGKQTDETAGATAQSPGDTASVQDVPSVTDPSPTEAMPVADAGPRPDTHPPDLTPANADLWHHRLLTEADRLEQRAQAFRQIAAALATLDATKDVAA